MTKPLRPSLKFISKLPTIKIKEVVKTTNIVIWKVELDKPVNIITGYQTIRDLNTFFIEAITLESFIKENEWQYSLKICITRGKGDVECLIDPRDEEWYIKNEWWAWNIMPQCFV